MGFMPWKKQLPMWATYFRLFLTPLLVFLLFFEEPWKQWLAVGLFILGAVSDGLDGYWARKYRAETKEGKLMDPITDKVLVLGVLVMLVYLHKVDPVLVILLLSRDIFIGGLRSVAATKGHVIGASMLGKVKTAIQVVALPFLIAPSQLNLPVLNILNLQLIGYVLLWTSVVLSLFSAINYIKAYQKFEN